MRGWDIDGIGNRPGVLRGSGRPFGSGGSRADKFRQRYRGRSQLNRHAISQQSGNDVHILLWKIVPFQSLSQILAGHFIVGLFFI